MQEIRNSTTNTLELRLSCTNPSMYRSMNCWYSSWIKVTPTWATYQLLSFSWVHLILMHSKHVNARVITLQDTISLCNEIPSYVIEHIASELSWLSCGVWRIQLRHFRGNMIGSDWKEGKHAWDEYHYSLCFYLGKMPCYVLSIYIYIHIHIILEAIVMEWARLPHYWAFVKGIHRWSVVSHHK